MVNGIKVQGTTPETVAEIKNGIVAILNIDRDEATIQTALQAYVNALKSLPPIHISNNLIVDGKRKKSTRASLGV